MSPSVSKQAVPKVHSSACVTSTPAHRAVLLPLMKKIHPGQTHTTCFCFTPEDGWFFSSWGECNGRIPAHSSITHPHVWVVWTYGTKHKASKDADSRPYYPGVDSCILYRALEEHILPYSRVPLGKGYVGEILRHTEARSAQRHLVCVSHRKCMDDDAEHVCSAGGRPPCPCMGDLAVVTVAGGGPASPPSP